MPVLEIMRNNPLSFGAPSTMGGTQQSRIIGAALGPTIAFATLGAGAFSFAGVAIAGLCGAGPLADHSERGYRGGVVGAAAVTMLFGITSLVFVFSAVIVMRKGICRSTTGTDGHGAVNPLQQAQPFQPADLTDIPVVPVVSGNWGQGVIESLPAGAGTSNAQSEDVVIFINPDYRFAVGQKN